MLILLDGVRYSEKKSFLQSDGWITAFPMPAGYDLFWSYCQYIITNGLFLFYRAMVPECGF